MSLISTYNSSEDKLQIETCLWCGGNATFKTIQNGYQEPSIFKIFHCQTCNTSFSMPRVNSNGIYELIYKDTQNIRGYNRYYRYQKKVLDVLKPLDFLANSEPSYWGPIEALQNILKLKKTERILEVGSGLGYFTYSLKKAGYNIHGLDISQEAVNDATEKFGDLYLCDDLFNYADKHKEEYDVVLMTEVIEHLSDPKSFIISIKQLLKNNGACIFTTPNKSFYPNDVAWFSDAPPIHCWWFSEESIGYLANLYSLKLKFIDFKKYYNKHPELFKVKDINSIGNSVFDKSGNLISIENKKTKRYKVPKWIKRIRYYALIRNCILQIIDNDMYKKGGVQSNILCAILIKS